MKAAILGGLFVYFHFKICLFMENYKLKSLLQGVK